jgi:predicted ATPase
MINTFSLKHFRGFEKSGPIPIRPLTCIVGRNSSGKSSILQALLLLRQSMEQRPLGSSVPQLNLRGPLIEAGDFRDLAHGHDVNTPVTFSFDLAVPEHPFQSVGLPLVTLDVPRPSHTRYWNPYSRPVPSSRDQPLTGKTRQASVSFDFLPEPPFGPTLTGLTLAVPGTGEAHFVRTTGERRIQHWRAYLTGLPSRSLGISFPPWSFIPEIHPRGRRAATRSRETRRRFNRFLDTSQRALWHLTSLLSEVRLVGPFRTPPARRYTFTGFGAPDTGVTGERAADLLITEKLLRTAGHLQSGVSFWLRRLGLARAIRVRDVARRSNIFSLEVFGAGTAKSANFADVGFGISQVLPVLVQGLLVPRGAIYIVQQPELHLHPDAQASLADFFLYLASQGITTLVETHSEYLLLRLRRRLAEGVRSLRGGLPRDSSPKTQAIGPDQVSVIYIGEEAGRAEARVLEIGDSFQFENLPPGFMSQAIDDRLLLMKALGRART